MNDDREDITQYQYEKKQIKNKIWSIKDTQIPALEKEIWKLKEKSRNVKVTAAPSKFGYYSRWYYTVDSNKYQDQIDRKEKQLASLERQV